MKLSTLKKSAAKSANHRGHRLKWGAAYGRANGPKSIIGRCKCGCEVVCAEAPAPNGIDIGGEAVAINCTL